MLNNVSNWIQQADIATLRRYSQKSFREIYAIALERANLLFNEKNKLFRSFEGFFQKKNVGFVSAYPFCFYCFCVFVLSSVILALQCNVFSPTTFLFKNRTRTSGYSELFSMKNHCALNFFCVTANQCVHWFLSCGLHNGRVFLPRFQRFSFKLQKI